MLYKFIYVYYFISSLANTLTLLNCNITTKYQLVQKKIVNYFLA